MTWTKIDDVALGDPEVLRVSRGARLMHLEALTWSSRYGTDGAIPTSALRMVTDEPDPTSAAGELVAAGLWNQTVDGYQLIWLLADQPLAAEAKRQREYNRHRQERLRKHKVGDHSLCDRCSAMSHRDRPATNGATNGANTSPRPVPSRIGTEKAEDGRGGAIAATASATPRGAAPPDEEWSLPWWPLDDNSFLGWEDGPERCARCRGAWPVDSLEDPAPEDGHLALLCPFCLATWRSTKDRCLAYTKEGEEQPARPCGNPPAKGEHWCKYHSRESSRGQAPLELRDLIERTNAQAAQSGAAA